MHQLPRHMIVPVLLSTLAIACGGVFDLSDAGADAGESDSGGDPGLELPDGSPGDSGQTTDATENADGAETPEGDIPVDVPTYFIVDTGQDRCYGSWTEMACGADGDALFGQDAQYLGLAPDLHDNGDGTVTDRVTGLMWQQSPGDKMTFDEALASAESFELAGYDDWRLPTIKELYSLIDFRGLDPSSPNSLDSSGLTPFIDDAVFDFEYGDPAYGERIIDSQFATSTLYVSETFGDDETMFGVNFADGRIKGYPIGPMPGQPDGKLFFVLYVRGGSGYGQNAFTDNGDGTVTDLATGLMWQQGDSGAGMDWAEALDYCESLELAGHDDWRLPNAKELQSIVDYTRSPDTTDSAAIDPVFEATPIVNEANTRDFAYYWTSTTHARSLDGHEGETAAYVAFGRALGYMNGRWQDVHGAGAQRSDPKTGDARDYPTGRGPQGDAIRIDNHVRCVRLGVASVNTD